MNPDQAMEIIRSEAIRISKSAPGTTWYLFGSILHEPNAASDIDVLVRCDSHGTAKVVRREATSLCEMTPVHLLLLTEEEEAEIQFVDSEGCRQFHPALRPPPQALTNDDRHPEPNGLPSCVSERHVRPI